MEGLGGHVGPAVGAQQIVEQGVAGFDDFRSGPEVVVHDDVVPAGLTDGVPYLPEHADIRSPEPVDGLLGIPTTNRFRPWRLRLLPR